MDAFITGFWTTLKSVGSWALDGCMFILKSAAYFIFDGLLTIIYSIVGALDLSSLVVNAAANWAALPSQAIYLVNALAIPQCISMMIYAIIIRMVVNLIPAAFTRI